MGGIEPGFLMGKHGAPYVIREMAPEEHRAHVTKATSLTRAEINANQGRFRKYIKHEPDVTQAQYNAVRDAFAEQLPYLAPENNHIPADTTVTSLLASKITVGDSAVYGKLHVPNKHVALFEKLQHELAAIDPMRATRQLYQAINGHRQTTVIFSEKALSGVAQLTDGSNLIHINPRITVQDERTGTITPIAVVLGHEIEHANVPIRFLYAQTEVASRNHTNAEEIRVIDGYENGMLRALGLSERTTHRSHIVPIDPADGRSLAFPMQTHAGEEFLRPGQTLCGTIVGADQHHVTIERHDGSRVLLDTKLLLVTITGKSQLERYGFEDPRSILEKATEQIRVVRSLIKRMKSSDFKDSDKLERLFATLYESHFLTEDPQLQIEKWRKAAERHDPVTLSINTHGLINLARTDTSPDPLGAPALKRKREREHNIRNICIASAIVLGISGLSTWAIVAANRKTKKKDVAQGVQQVLASYSG